MDIGAWWTTVHGVTKESDMTMTKQQQRVNFRIISSTTAFNLGLGMYQSLANLLKLEAALSKQVDQSDFVDP